MNAFQTVLDNYFRRITDTTGGIYPSQGIMSWASYDFDLILNLLLDNNNVEFKRQKLEAVYLKELREKLPFLKYGDTLT